MRKSLSDEQVTLLRRCHQNEGLSAIELYDLLGDPWRVSVRPISQALRGLGAYARVITDGYSYRPRNNVEASTTHGGTGTKVYDLWSGIKERCNLKGGYAEVYVCEEWQSFEPFRSWATQEMFRRGITELELGSGIDQYTIDRFPDQRGHYSPENCRLATKREQQRNLASNKELTIFGQTKIMVEWSEDDRCEVSYKILKDRLLAGWDPERALTTPKRGAA